MKKRVRKVSKKKVVSKKVKSKKVSKVKKLKVTSPRVSSGIPNLDKIIGKGFPRGSVNLVVGGAGSGKTIFATQFLLEGAKKGEPVVYITFEEKKERFYTDMKVLGWDMEALEKKKMFAFIEYTPEQVKKMLEEGGGEVEVAIEDIKAKRIVIDSISSFALLFKNELEKREAALALFELLRKWDVTTLLTLEQEPTLGMNEEHITSPLEFEVDTIILFYFLRIKGDRIRELEILKMRRTDHSKKVYRFKIGKGGIKVTGKGRAKY